MFDFLKTITNYIDPVLDFVLGEDVMTSDMARRGEGPRREGGFLEFAKSGAKAYAAMTDSDEDREAFQATEYKAPKITRFSGRAPISPGASQAVQPLGASDPRVRNLYNNLQRRSYANADMSRLSQNFRVNLTKRQGTRTIPLEPAKAPQAKEVAPAAIRKHEKDVV